MSVNNEIEKVYCPYCGYEMKVTEPHLHTKRSGIGVMLQCHYRCDNCRSGAPWVDGEYKSEKDCIEAAYNAAIKRINAN